MQAEVARAEPQQQRADPLTALLRAAAPHAPPRVQNWLLKLLGDEAESALPADRHEDKTAPARAT